MTESHEGPGSPEVRIIGTGLIGTSIGLALRGAIEALAQWAKDV